MESCVFQSVEYVLANAQSVEVVFLNTSPELFVARVSAVTSQPRQFYLQRLEN